MIIHFVLGTPKKSRPKSLAISTQTKLLTLEEAQNRVLTSTKRTDPNYIEVGKLFVQIVLLCFYL